MIAILICIASLLLGCLLAILVKSQVVQPQDDHLTRTENIIAYSLLGFCLIVCIVLYIFQVSHDPLLRNAVVILAAAFAAGVTIIPFIPDAQTHSVELISTYVLSGSLLLVLGLIAYKYTQNQEEEDRKEKIGCEFKSKIYATLSPIQKGSPVVLTMCALSDDKLANDDVIIGLYRSLDDPKIQVFVLDEYKQRNMDDPQKVKAFLNDLYYETLQTQTQMKEEEKEKDEQDFGQMLRLREGRYDIRIT